MVIVVAASACGLQEHPDFMIGRQCVPEVEMPCDEGETCLPHRIGLTRFEDYRCRDKRSFVSYPGGEAPIAYCDDTLVCPGDLVCRPDRIRLDGGPRPNVCKPADDVFIPPTFDAGVSGGP